MTNEAITLAAIWLCCMTCYVCIGWVIDEYGRRQRRRGEGWLLSGILMCSVFVWSSVVVYDPQRRISALEEQVAELVEPRADASTGEQVRDLPAWAMEDE